MQAFTLIALLERHYTLAVTAVSVFLTALLVGMVLTRLMRTWAPRVGLVDQPDGHRKLHKRATALGGGAAVFLATVLVVAGQFAFSGADQHAFGWRISELLSLMLAGAVIVSVGLVDDHSRLRGREKLLGQFLACSILIADGLVIHRFALFGWQLDLGLLAIPFTYAWLLGAINSLNLLDGIDGLATLLGIILVMTLAALAAMVGHSEVALVALAFAGALCGFMRYNFPPATIFLGDAGSMLIGLGVGALAIHGSLKGPGTVLLAAPLAILTIPAFDSIAAVLRRKLTGRSIYTTDRGHLHHRLLDALGSNLRVLLCVGIACALTSAAALGSVALHSDLVALASLVGVVGVFIITGLFGRAEFLLLASRLRTRAMSLLNPPSPGGRVRQSRVQLQGSRDWQVLWEMLTESADKLRLNRVHLDVNLPNMREGYNATWECGGAEEIDDCWCIELPLRLGLQTVGRLSVRGRRNGHAVQEDMIQLLEMLESFEERFCDLAKEQRVLAPAPMHVAS